MRGNFGIEGPSRQVLFLKLGLCSGFQTCLENVIFKVQSSEVASTLMHNFNELSVGPVEDLKYLFSKQKVNGKPWQILVPPSQDRANVLFF